MARACGWGSPRVRARRARPAPCRDGSSLPCTGRRPGCAGPSSGRGGPGQRASRSGRPAPRARRSGQGTGSSAGARRRSRAAARPGPLAARRSRGRAAPGMRRRPGRGRELRDEGFASFVHCQGIRRCRRTCRIARRTARTGSATDACSSRFQTSPGCDALATHFRSAANIRPHGRASGGAVSPEADGASGVAQASAVESHAQRRLVCLQRGIQHRLSRAVVEQQVAKVLVPVGPGWHLLVRNASRTKFERGRMERQRGSYSPWRLAYVDEQLASADSLV